MTCDICKTFERDLNDVVRTLRRRVVAQTDACPATLMDSELEIRALSKAKAEIEERYSKHQKSCYAVNSAEHSYTSRGL